MRKILLIGIIIIVLIVVIIGFVIAGFFTGVFGIPSIKNIDNSWGEVTADTTEIITNVTIENPNPFDISLSQIEYTITMNNITMAEGLEQGAILEKGESTIQISSFLDNAKISQWWPSHIINNEITILEIKPRVVLDAWLLDPAVEVPSRTEIITTDFLNSITNTENHDDLKPVEFALFDQYRYGERHRFNWYDSVDIDRNARMEIKDIATLANYWLKTESNF